MSITNERARARLRIKEQVRGFFAGEREQPYEDDAPEPKPENHDPTDDWYSTDWQAIGLGYIDDLIDLMGAEEAAVWFAQAKLDELCERGKHELACHRMFEKINELEDW